MTNLDLSKDLTIEVFSEVEYSEKDEKDTKHLQAAYEKAQLLVKTLEKEVALRHLKHLSRSTR